MQRRLPGGDELGLAWNDPEIGVKWPTDQPLLPSPKDREGKPLSRLLDRLPLRAEAVRILVTGAAGQLGRSLTAPLATTSPRTRAPSSTSRDLAAVRAAVSAVKPDVVINAAAYNRVDDAGGRRDRRVSRQMRAARRRNLALATGERGVPIVHVSTDYVFDGRGTRAVPQYDAPNPQSA